jgi:O-antigen/teichoic acid export membrane protein
MGIVPLSKKFEWMSRVRAHLAAPLYGNAYILIANQLAAAALGIIFWMLAARLYDAATIGRNVALFSSVMILATVAELGWRAGLTRYVPRAGAHTAHLILAAYGIVVASSIIAASVFFIGGARFFPDASWGVSTGHEIVLLILATAAWSIFDLGDSVLTGMRQTAWVLVKNTAFNLTKMLLLIVGVPLFAEYGIIGAWFLAAACISLPLNALLFRRLVPRHIGATRAQAGLPTPRAMFVSVAGDYVGSMISEVGVRALPLLVLAQRGASASAYFYQAWVLSTLLQLIAWGVANSFTVEASARLEQIAVYSRRALMQMARLVVPAVGATLVAAPFVLGLFGEAYARESTALLQWLALATLPFVLTTWYLSYARVRGDVRAILVTQTVLVVSVLGLTYVLVPLWGIAGTGVAWLCGQTLVALMIAWKTAPLFFASGGK